MIPFARIGMVGINNDRGIFQFSAGVCISLEYLHHRFIVKIGNIVSVFVHLAAKHGVRVLVSASGNLIVMILEYLCALRRINRVEQNGNTAAHGVLEPYGQFDSA